MCLAFMPVYEWCLQEENLSAGSLSSRSLSLCVSGTVLAPGMLLWTGAPPLFCYSIFPLFAQRLGAIIGPNTLHYSYLCSVHTRLSTKDIQVCEEANSYVHSCTEARRLAIQTQSFPLSLAWCCLLCDFVRCPEASHSWLWKVWTCRQSPGKQIGESVYPAAPPHLSDFLQIKKRCALLWANATSSFQSRQWLQKLGQVGSVPHKDPLSQTWTGAYL